MKRENASWTKCLLWRVLWKPHSFLFYGTEDKRSWTESYFPFSVEFAKEQGGLSTEAIKKAFDATEEEFCHLVRRSFPARPQIASVGSCCLVGVISNDLLYVANLGDSRAVLGRRVLKRGNKPVAAERLSTDHNVAIEEVRKEVEALHPDDSHIVVYTRGVWRIKGIIQVQRARFSLILNGYWSYRGWWMLVNECVPLGWWMLVNQCVPLTGLHFSIGFLCLASLTLFEWILAVELITWSSGDKLLIVTSNAVVTALSIAVL